MSPAFLPFITDTGIIGPMIASFKDGGTEDIFDGVDSKAVRKSCPKPLWPVARKRLDQLNRVRELNELAIPQAIAWKG